jgi:hypothetical protein
MTLNSSEHMKAYCLFGGCGINAFRMASSNSSPAEKSYACAYIAFLTRIFSWYADSTSVVPEPEGPSLYSQDLATGSYPEPTESTPRPQQISQRSILIPFSHLRLVLPSSFFPMAEATFITNLRERPQHLGCIRATVYFATRLIFFSSLTQNRPHTAERQPGWLTPAVTWGQS